MHPETMEIYQDPSNGKQRRIVGEDRTEIYIGTGKLKDE